MRTPLAAAFVAALTLVVGLPPRAARSTSVERLDPAALVARARTIAWGDCISVQAEWNPARTRILTRVQLATREVLKGDRVPTVELLLPGGERDGMAYVVHGVPRFRPGLEAVVHVAAPHPTTGVAVPVGLGQGVHAVTRAPGAAPRVRRDLRDLNLVVPGVAGGGPGGVEEEPLDDLLARVRALVAAEAVRAGGGR